jgi:hypothetical protein
MAERAIRGRNAPWSERAELAAGETSAAENHPVETNNERERPSIRLRACCITVLGEKPGSQQYSSHCVARGWPPDKTRHGAN